MDDGELYETADVVEAMQALHSALTDDLEDLEKRICAIARADTAASAHEAQDMTEYYDARTALHSGLASITEVLGWIQWKTEEEPEGDIAVALQPLPTLRGCSVH